MKSIRIYLPMFVVSTFFAFGACAQPGYGPPPGQRGFGPPPGQRPFRGPGNGQGVQQQPGQFPGRPDGGFGGLGLLRNPLMRALDTDKNGELSPSEIANASAALQTLDKNGDGTLTRDEILPRPSRDQSAQPPQRPGAGMAARILRFDRDGDGSVTGEELPPHLKPILDRVDTNQDGILDATELEAMPTNRPPRPARGNRPPRGGETPR